MKFRVRRFYDRGVRLTDREFHHQECVVGKVNSYLLQESTSRISSLNGHISARLSITSPRCVCRNRYQRNGAGRRREAQRGAVAYTRSIRSGTLRQPI